MFSSYFVFFGLFLGSVEKSMTYNAGCSRHFRSLSSLKSGPNFVQQGWQFLFPNINFTCDNNVIEKWIFNGRINGIIGISVVEIQLWQRISPTFYTIDKSWLVTQDKLVSRNDGLFELQVTNAVTKSDHALGLYIPHNDNIDCEVDLYFDSSETPVYYYEPAFMHLPSSSSLYLSNLATGTHLVPKLTVEFCPNAIENTATVTSSSIIVSKSPVTSREYVTSTETLVILPMTTTPDKISRTQSNTLNLITPTPLILKSITRNDSAVEKNVTQSTASTTTKFFISSPSFSIVTSSSILQSTNLVIYPDNYSDNSLHQYILLSIVTGAGIIVIMSILCMLFMTVTIYIIFTERRRSHPMFAAEPSFANQRRQSATESLYTNAAYTMNRISAQSFHEYDRPTFSMKSDLIESATYNKVNRTSMFDLNPAYNVVQLEEEEEETSPVYEEPEVLKASVCM